MADYQAMISFIGRMASSMVWESEDTGSQMESWLPPVTTDASMQVGVAECQMIDVSSQWPSVQPVFQSTAMQSTEPVMLPNGRELRFMGRRQVASCHFVSLQMPSSLWEYFEELSRRDTHRYVAAIGDQRCAFVENERRHADTVIGASHLYADAVYAVYRFLYQSFLVLLGQR